VKRKPEKADRVLTGVMWAVRVARDAGVHLPFEKVLTWDRDREFAWRHGTCAVEMLAMLALTDRVACVRVLLTHFASHVRGETLATPELKTTIVPAAWAWTRGEATAAEVWLLVPPAVCAADDAAVVPALVACAPDGRTAEKRVREAYPEILHATNVRGVMSAAAPYDAAQRRVAAAIRRLVPTPPTAAQLAAATEALTGAL